MHEPRGSPFLFAVSQAGAEKLTREELQAVRPELRLAFSRPGFVTLKGPSPIDPALELAGLVFTRAYGVSLGKIEIPETSDPAEAASTIAKVASGIGPKPVLHVFAREGLEAEAPGEDAARTAAVLSRAMDVAGIGPAEWPGQPVVDVVLVEPREWWIGWHIHSRAHSPFPGGRPPLAPAGGAPSRARLKIDEALLVWSPPIEAGDVALEIGSAPGGAATALLDRGVRVVGIDPAEMDSGVLARAPAFAHVQKSAGSVRREDLPGKKIDWLLLDVNAAPEAALPLAERLASMVSPSLLGVLLTLKIDDYRRADRVPRWISRARGLGPGLVEIAAKQLTSNKSEVTVYGLTRKGMKRANLRARR